MRLFLVAFLLVSMPAPSQNAAVPDNHSAQAMDGQQSAQSPPVIPHANVSGDGGLETDQELRGTACGPQI